MFNKKLKRVTEDLTKAMDFSYNEQNFIQKRLKDAETNIACMEQKIQILESQIICNHPTHKFAIEKVEDGIFLRTIYVKKCSNCNKTITQYSTEREYQKAEIEYKEKQLKQQKDDYKRRKINED